MEGFETADTLDKFLSKTHSESSKLSEHEIKSPHPLMIADEFPGGIISNRILESSDLKSWNLSGIKLHNCIFKNVDFTGTMFWMCTIQDCYFENCDLDRFVLRKCDIKHSEFTKCRSRFYVNISESYMYSNVFSGCNFDGLEISGTDTSDIQFQNCFLTGGRYQANFTFRENLTHFPKKYLTQEDEELLNTEEVYQDLLFDECHIELMDFRMVNFIDTFFKFCELSRCSFIDCEFYEYNIDETNNRKGWGTNTIDLNSLVQSKIPSDILKTVFNINPEVQPKIQSILAERKLSSVFISYSLQDSFIADKINGFLKKEGVTTFLWERDAPGGQTLKSIMKSNINSKDRLLFIASENSLKSEACHFELTEGRKKQDKLWKTILFPIHIDNFLFEIEYDQIRPRKKRDEYWENIEELKDINSLDFRLFANSKDFDSNQNEFGRVMSNLIDSLRIEQVHEK